MEITKMSKSNLAMLSRLYLEVRKASFSSNAQGQSVGSELVGFAISLNSRSLKLKCMAKNESAIGFYEKNGFIKENKVMDSDGGYYLMYFGS